MHFRTGTSYGFRRGKSQHNALDALSVGLTQRHVNWVLDADIKGFFDNIPHEKLLQAVRVRIGDRRLLKLIEQWPGTARMRGRGSGR